MPADLDRDLLVHTLVTTLEEAAFVFAEPADPKPGDWPSGIMLAAGLPFSGRPTGTLTLLASPDFCIELAANMLGLEPVDEAAERAALDALGELLNVICGVLIEAWQGPDSTLRMGIPEVRQTSAESFLGQSSESLLVAIRTDDGRLVAMGARLDDESGAC